MNPLLFRGFHSAVCTTIVLGAGTDLPVRYPRRIALVVLAGCLNPAQPLLPIW